MATENVSTYASRASARKGAKRAGLLSFDIVQDGSRFKFVTAVQAAKPTAKSTKVKAPRTGTKVQSVMDMAARKDGCTLEQIVETLGVSRAAGQSLVQDVRRKGVAVKLVDGVYRI